MATKRNVNELFKIPKSTARAMKENLAQLDILTEVQENLKAVGLLDPKTIKQLADIKKLTVSILENFEVAE